MQSRSSTTRQKSQRKQKSPVPRAPEGKTDPTPRIQAGVKQQSHKPLGMRLLDSGDGENNASISLEWKPVKIGANISFICRISAQPGQSIEANITQASYFKTIKDVSRIEVGPIPVAAEGVQGHLLIRNAATGDSIDVTWEWAPTGSAGRAMASRLTKRISQGVQKLKKSSQEARGGKGQSGESQRAETRFFDIQAQGGCFAFILDISLSMEGARLEYCKRELIQSLNNLPEHALFGIFLYADTVYTPEGQKDWLQANRTTVTSVVNWISAVRVKPYTRPVPAFRQAFSYSTAPGVIFFLTDGELFDFTARDCALITGAGKSFTGMIGGLFTNREPKPVPVIHTIGLGDQAGKGVLQQIANDHSGSCRVIDTA